MIVFQVFLPFAFGYFLSYLFRVVNAVIAPATTAETVLLTLLIIPSTSLLVFRFLRPSVNTRLTALPNLSPP